MYFILPSGQGGMRRGYGASYEQQLKAELNRAQSQYTTTYFHITYFSIPFVFDYQMYLLLKPLSSNTNIRQKYIFTKLSDCI